MKGVISILLLGIVCMLPAQKIHWGQLQPKPDKNVHISHAIGRTAKGIFSLQTDTRYPSNLPPVIQRFNNELKLEKQGILRFQSQYGTLQLERSIVLGEHLYLIARRRSPVGAKIRLFYQEIDQETLLPKQDFRPIAEANWLEGFFREPMAFKISEDKSKFLMYNYFPCADGNRPRNWIAVFDQELKCIWSNSAESTQVDSTLLFVDYEVANNGDVLVLASKPKKSRYGVEVDPHLTVLHYGGDGKKVKEYSFSPGNFHLWQTNLQLDNKGHLYCTGLLKNDLEEISGAFAGIVDQSTGMANFHAGYFIDQELKAFSQAPKHLIDFSLRASYISTAGVITLALEERSVMNTKDQLYGQVLLITYPADLSARSIASLKKKQISFDRGYFDSFVFFFKEEEQCLLYNEKDISQQATFSATGLKNTPMVFPYGNKVKIRPFNCVKLSEQQIWLYAETEDKKQYQVGLLTH